jgi:predicted RNA-binding Zn-ribbon protein involved in translation (DUF1610 family)
MRKHTSFCPKCSASSEIEIDPSKAPYRCEECGEVLIIKSEQMAQGGNEAPPATGGAAGALGGAAPPQPGVPMGPLPPPVVPVPPPVQLPIYPHYPGLAPARPRTSPQRAKDNLGLIQAMLVAAGVLGFLFWVSYFLVGYWHGTFELDATSPGSTTFFMFNVIMLASSFIALVGGMKKSFRVVILGCVFGILSFGFFVGTILSLVSLFMAASNRDAFEE